MSNKNVSKNVSEPNLEEYVVCPYDKDHRLMPSRLALHLVRCARNFPLAKLVPCPFNNTHLHSVNDMKMHVETCPNRSMLVQFKAPTMLPQASSQASNFYVESKEDWDNEPPTSTYDPQAHCDNAFIIRNPQGNAPAARREFRDRERRRFIESNQF